MSKWGLMPNIRMLVPDEWHILRDVRVSALHESPQNFLSTYEREEKFDEASWRAEFSRGDWYVGIADGQPPDEPVSLVGITREPAMPAHQRFLEYLWVMPGFRGRSIAFDMINLVLDRLKSSGIRTVFLWVLDGNKNAKRLYKRLGFVSCNYRQPLKAQPGRSEELMKMDLGSVRQQRLAAKLRARRRCVTYAAYRICNEPVNGLRALTAGAASTGIALGRTSKQCHTVRQEVLDGWDGPQVRMVPEVRRKRRCSLLGKKAQRFLMRLAGGQDRNVTQPHVPVTGPGLKVALT